jgi:hypothetical protein
VQALLRRLLAGISRIGHDLRIPAGESDQTGARGGVCRAPPWTRIRLRPAAFRAMR